MVRPEVILKRLGKVEEYLAILAKLRQCPRDEFLHEPEKYGSAERFLQLAIEALNDVGSHVVADLNMGVVDSAADVPRLLEQNGHLGVNLRDVWVRMIGFRNVLVHDYLDVDRQVVYDVLQTNLGDIRALARVFAKFL